MKELDYLKDMLCKELSKITQQNDFTTSTLETSFKIVDMLKDIEEIKEKEGMQSYDKDGSYGYWGVGYGGRMPYADGYGGGRYSYGNGNMNGHMGGNNYSYDNGYSRMSPTDKMMTELQMMMDESTSARDKAIIQRALDELKK